MKNELNRVSYSMAQFFWDLEASYDDYLLTGMRQSGSKTLRVLCLVLLLVLIED